MQVFASIPSTNEGGTLLRGELGREDDSLLRPVAQVFVLACSHESRDMLVEDLEGRVVVRASGALTGAEANTLAGLIQRDKVYLDATGHVPRPIPITEPELRQLEVAEAFARHLGMQAAHQLFEGEALENLKPAPVLCPTV